MHSNESFLGLCAQHKQEHWQGVEKYDPFVTYIYDHKSTSCIVRVETQFHKANKTIYSS